MKRFTVLGLIIVLVASIAAIGCKSGSSTHHATPTHVATQTATPTEEPEEAWQLPDNYMYSMEMSDSNGGTATMQYWVKGEKWRTDWSSSAEGQESEMKLIYDGQFAYIYMPEANMVYKYTDSWAIANPGAAYSQQFQDDYYGDVSDTTMLAGFESACAGGASLDGNEDVNGIPCTKFTCNFDGGVSYTWISDSGWPVKVETTLDDGTTTTAEYTEIQVPADIDDSTFDINTVAPGATVQEVP